MGNAMGHRDAEHQSLYDFPFTDKQWDEIEALGFPDFEPDRHSAGYSRPTWLAIGEIALGKAQRIEDGTFDMGDDDDLDNPQWADELREIANIINSRFRPGDGQY